MADDKKRDEQGSLAKAIASVQHAELKAIEIMGGSDAADLAAKAIQAGNAGNRLERAKLGFEADAKIAAHSLEAVKNVGAELEHFTEEHRAGITIGGGLLGLGGALVGAQVQEKITGGDEVNEPAPVSTPPVKRRDVSPRK